MAKRTNLIVWIENCGDTRIDAEHMASAHDGKVVLVAEGLPDTLREAIAHAHDAESVQKMEAGDDD